MNVAPVSKSHVAIQTVVMLIMLCLYTAILYMTRNTPIYHPLYLLAVIYVWFPWFAVMFLYDHIIVARYVGRTTTIFFEILLFILISF